MAASAETLLDAIALVEAHLNHDGAGVNAILAACDLPQVASVLVFLAAGLLHGAAARDPGRHRRQISGSV
jgi:hypothetical protein